MKLKLTLTFSMAFLFLSPSTEAQVDRRMPAVNQSSGGFFAGGHFFGGRADHFGFFRPHRNPLSFFNRSLGRSFPVVGNETRVEDPWAGGWWYGTRYGYQGCVGCDDYWFRPKHYSSSAFVERWREQDPGLADPYWGPSESALLQVGMDQESVMKVLGSPVQRIQLGTREQWKYSAYSIIFEAGKMVGFR